MVHAVFGNTETDRSSPTGDQLKAEVVLFVGFLGLVTTVDEQNLAWMENTASSALGHLQFTSLSL